MASTIQLNVARLIQKELSNFFMVEGRSHFGNAMITVTQVGVTKDLSIARVYVSLFATNDKTALLNQIKGKLKHEKVGQLFFQSYILGLQLITKSKELRFD